MTTSERTFYFNIAVGIFNIVIGLAIEFLLIGGCLLILARFPQYTDSVPTNVLLPFILLIGLIVAIMISTKVIAWIIVHFNLENKLDPKMVNRYVKKEF